MADIRIEHLDDANYATWAVRMKGTLLVKGLWSAVEPAAGVLKSEVSQEKDQMALGLMWCCVKEHLLPAISGCASAKEAWGTLAEMFKSKSNARKLQLRRELHSLQKENHETLVGYFGRAKAIWMDLKAMGSEMPETEIVWSVLGGLPGEPYGTMCTILTAFDESLTLDGCMHKLLAVEQQHEQKESAHAMVAHRGGRGKGRGMGRVGSNQQQWEGELLCWHCNKPGHKKQQCREWLKLQQAQGATLLATTSVAF